jgi:hypothetical protein
VSTTHRRGLQVFLTDASGELLSVELREHPDVAVSRFPFKEAPATYLPPLTPPPV